MAMLFGDLRRKLDQSRLYDWTMRLPIVAYTSYILIYDIVGFRDQAAQAQIAAEQFDAAFVIAAFARISQWMFVALLAFLHLTRYRPVAKSEGILPRITALLAVCLPPLFMVLDRAEPSLTFNAISLVVGLAATVMSFVTLSFLGRSLSIMPEARRLVTDGPYALSRHPLYVCEMLGFATIVLQYRSIAAVALFALVVLVQVARARWEETVLRRAFPEFAAYGQQTPFLIPRDPGRFVALFFEDSLARRRSAAVVTSAFGLLALALATLPAPVG